MELYYPTHYRADALLFGVLLRFISFYRLPVSERLERAWPYWILGLPLALLIPLLFPLEEYGWLTGTVGFTVLYLSFGSLVFLAGARPDFGRSGPKLFTLVAHGLALSGIYSYTIYLVHSVVSATYAHGVLTGSATIHCFWFLVLSIAGGVLVSHLVERPFLRWRDRFSPSSHVAIAGRS